MSPLVALTLIGFGIVLVFALLVWTLLTPARRTPARGAATSTPAPRLSNDELRGARAPRGRRGDQDDPFERFLRAEQEPR